MSPTVLLLSPNQRINFFEGQLQLKSVFYFMVGAVTQGGADGKIMELFFRKEQVYEFCFGFWAWNGAL